MKRLAVLNSFIYIEKKYISLKFINILNKSFTSNNSETFYFS